MKIVDFISLLILWYVIAFLFVNNNLMFFLSYLWGHLLSLKVGKVKSVCEPSGPSGQSLSRFPRVGVFLLLPGWDASPSQGYPQH